MLRPRVPLGKLAVVAPMFALPALLVVGALLIIGMIGALAALAAAGAAVVVAALVAAPIVRDLAQLSHYGDGLAREGTATRPELSGWAPASELAATMRRVLRGAEARERARAGSIQGTRMFDALPQPVILIDAARRVKAVNRAARDLVGADPTGADLAGAIRAPRVLEAVDAVLAQREARAVEFAVAAPTERYFGAEIVPFAQEPADGADVLIVLYDLTERRRTEQMRADFVANASHELRTPLATLIGFIETLKGPARDDAEARENFLGLMGEQAHRMSRLVRDLLALSTIELGEHAAPTGPVDIAAVLKRVAGTLEIEAAKKDVKLVVAAAAVPPLAGDEDQLTQLFQNLIDNAIKYGRKGGTVRVTIEPTADVPKDLPGAARAAAQGLVKLSVSDQGPGIAAVHIPRLTERFYRVDAARSREVGGTGLGLAIVKHIVNRHRGVLQISSVEGVGSTFTVILPAAADRATH